MRIEGQEVERKAWLFLKRIIVFCVKSALEDNGSRFKESDPRIDALYTLEPLHNVQVGILKVVLCSVIFIIGEYSNTREGCSK